MPVELMEFIKYLENALGIEAVKNYLPMQNGDVPATYADIDAISSAVGFEPRTNLSDGIGAWVKWYKAHIAS